MFSKNHREALGEESRFTPKFRMAVAFVLGCAAFGIAERLVSSFVKSPAETAVTQANSASEGKGSNGKPNSKNRIAADEFDRSPESYVDPTQCRELVLRWDGKVVSDDEVEARAEDIGREKRLALARKLIAKLCLADGRDTMGIENAFLEGYTEFYWSEDERGCRYLVNLIKKGEGENTICLEGPPPCEPSLSDVSDEGRKNMEEIAQKKEKLQKLKEMGYATILERVDLAAMKDEIRRLNLNDTHWNELIIRIETLKAIAGRNESNEALALETCKLYGFMMGEREALEGEGVPDTPILDENMERFEDFREVVFMINGIGDEEECIRFLK